MFLVVNVALGKPAAQLSLHQGIAAQPTRAVDGCTLTHLWDNCCATTAASSQPWWGVDLGSKFNVARPNQGARANKVDSGSAARVGSQQTNEENSEAEPR